MNGPARKDRVATTTKELDLFSCLHTACYWRYTKPRTEQAVATAVSVEYDVDIVDC